MQTTATPRAITGASITFDVGTTLFKNTPFISYVSTATFKAKKIEGRCGNELHYALQTNGMLPEFLIIIKNEKSSSDLAPWSGLFINTRPFGSDEEGTPLTFKSDKHLIHPNTGYGQLLRQEEPLMLILTRALPYARSFFANEGLKSLLEYEHGKQSSLADVHFYLSANVVTNDMLSLCAFARSQEKHRFMRG